MVNKELFCKDKYFLPELLSVEGNSIAVHCPTETQARRFLEALSDMNVKWVSGAELLSTLHWSNCKEETCYVIKNKRAIAYTELTNIPDEYLVIEESDIVYPAEDGEILSYKEILRRLNSGKETALSV